MEVARKRIQWFACLVMMFHSIGLVLGVNHSFVTSWELIAGTYLFINSAVCRDCSGHTSLATHRNSMATGVSRDEKSRSNKIRKQKGGRPAIAGSHGQCFPDRGFLSMGKAHYRRAAEVLLKDGGVELSMRSF